MRAFQMLLGAALLAALNTSAPCQAVEASGEGIEVLTRGPVHEAFASTIEFNPKATATISKRPPDPIEELPPEAKPEGEDSVWLPGYWSWDDDREDFIWISGAWRVAPHGQRWVSGYWAEASDGWRWVSGFWTSIEAEEIAYQDEAPPESLEQGPTYDAPSEDHFWVPGCWTWRERYVWRPGYWWRTHPGWCWVPDRHYWTPRGYIFGAGYWDYPYERRGFLFAPAYFHRPIYRTPGYYYSPSVAINVGDFFFHLFARPRYHHYYFGDYHDAGYARRGFYPWYEFSRWGGYDPVFVYQRARFDRGPRAWDSHVRDRYRYYRENENVRPAHTYAQLQRQVARLGDREARDFSRLAVDLREVQGDNRFLNHRVARLEDRQRQDIRRQTRERIDLVRNERVQVEQNARVALRPGQEGDARRAERPSKLRLPDADLIRREARERRTAERAARPRERGDTRPSEGRPGEGRPGEGRPGEGRPSEARPGEEGRRGEGRPDRRREEDRSGRPDRPREGRPDQPPTAQPPTAQPPAGQPPAAQPPAGQPGTAQPPADERARPPDARRDRPRGEGRGERPGAEGRAPAAPPSAERPGERRVERPETRRPESREVRRPESPPESRRPEG
ncbi:MAG: hypothetical protein WD176_07305, partial [Pirellulales bacterium]